MKRALLAGLVLFLPHVAHAQTDAQMIERALAGAPERAREGAMVVKWNADHTYEVLKEGTNTWLCYDRSGEGNRPAFALAATSTSSKSIN